MKLRFLIFALMAVSFPPSCGLVDQPQARLEQARKEWIQKQYEQNVEQQIKSYKEWKTSLGSVVAAEFVHQAPTEENPTPTIIIKLSPKEVKELVAILSASEIGGFPAINPDTVPLELNAQGEVVYSMEIEGRYFAPIDYRTDFLHLYDADGNEIMPELSPYEDDICSDNKIDALTLRKRDSPPWEQPFIWLPHDQWTRYWQLPSFVKFRDAVQKIQGSETR